MSWRGELKQKAKDWVANPENHVNSDFGTRWHILSRWIHRLAKLTAFLPQPKIKHRPKVLKLDKETINQLKRKRADYFIWSKNNGHLDENHFVDWKHCDATLFSGLLSSSIPVELEAARDYLGMWCRRPVQYTPCHVIGIDSGASFSRDMCLGLLWWLWFSARRGLAEDTYQTYAKHDFVMGYGDPSRLFMMPGLEATLAEIIAQKGGKRLWWARRQIQSWPKTLKGYPVHLSICHILLRGWVMGGITEDMYRSLEHYSIVHKRNPLYQFAFHLYSDGDMSWVRRLLLNPHVSPNKHLPTKANRHSSWINQRDYGPDWLSTRDSDRNREHSGGDFLHVAGLILKGLEENDHQRRASRR